MEQIPPKDRFSQHAAVSSVSPDAVRAAISRFGWKPDKCAAHVLSGGFTNANFLVERSGDRQVFRFYSSDRATAERERDLLDLLTNTPVPAPKPLDLFEIDGKPVGVISYLDGITLEDKLLSGDPIHPRLYQEIGRNLGLIHQIRFEETGFIGAGAKPGREFEESGPFLRNFILHTLDWLKGRPERLDAETNRRLEALVEDKWPIVLETEPRRELVHCDFNPKNILVARGDQLEVIGVLDWEFCLSGNGLDDLGNFFRFSSDYAAGAPESFERGYREANPDLPGTWREVALLLDLGSMCSFLERSEDDQKSFRTARAVCRATLEHFGYV